MASSDAVDLTGDGGVLKRVERCGTFGPDSPPPGSVVALKFTARLEDGTEVDSSLAARARRHVFAEMPTPAAAAHWQALPRCTTLACWSARPALPLMDDAASLEWLSKPARPHSERRCFGGAQRACIWRSLYWQETSDGSKATWSAFPGSVAAAAGQLPLSQHFRVSVVPHKPPPADARHLDETVLLVDRRNHFPHASESMLPVTSYPRAVDRIFISTNRTSGGRSWGEWLDAALDATKQHLHELHGRSPTVDFVHLAPQEQRSGSGSDAAPPPVRIDTLIVYEGGVFDMLSGSPAHSMRSIRACGQPSRRFGTCSECAAPLANSAVAGRFRAHLHALLGLPPPLPRAPSSLLLLGRPPSATGASGPKRSIRNLAQLSEALRAAFGPGTPSGLPLVQPPDLGELSMREQVALLSRAGVMVGSHGAAIFAVNLFMPAGGVVVELFPLLHTGCYLDHGVAAGVADYLQWCAPEYARLNASAGRAGCSEREAGSYTTGFVMDGGYTDADFTVDPESIVAMMRAPVARLVAANRG